MEAKMRSSILLVLIGLGGVLLGVLGAATTAQAGICDDLWVQRNSIYKAYGYCFKTPKAINYFGNAGCQTMRAIFLSRMPIRAACSPSRSKNARSAVSSRAIFGDRVRASVLGRITCWIQQ